MINFKDITTKNWQCKLDSFGEIVEDVEDIDQCIKIILKTRKGEVPHRPDFGCYLWKYIDAPVSIAKPNINREVITALKKYEPRMEIVKVNSTSEDKEGSHIKLYIEWKVKDTEQINLTGVLI